MTKGELIKNENLSIGEILSVSTLFCVTRYETRYRDVLSAGLSRFKTVLVLQGWYTVVSMEYIISELALFASPLTRH